MQKKTSTVLRERLQKKEILLRPAVAIAIHAQIAEACGMEAVSISGANTSMHVLGLPDAGLITMTEMVENVRRVCGAVKIPVIVDCDTGFGNAINVRRTVKEVINAGAAGLFFEDQASPKRCAQVKGKELISIDEAVGKFRAALDVRDELDPDFLIIARTDARTAVGGGMEEVKKRIRAFEDAGVDMIYVESVQSTDEIREARSVCRGLFTCNVRAVRPHPTLQELEDLGLNMTVGNMFFRAGLVAMWNLVAEMKKRGVDPMNEFLDSVQNHPLGGFGHFDLAGFPQIVEWEKKYLPAEQLEKYDQSIGLYDPNIGYEPERLQAV